MREGRLFSGRIGVRTRTGRAASATPRIADWIAATRPRTLPASVAPVLIGVAMAWRDDAAHAPTAVTALVAAALIQIGANFSNDYFDFVNGADTAERIGPRRMTQAGLAKPGAMLRASVLVFVLATLIGAHLVARGGWPIVLIGVASILSGVLYTAGPARYGYRGLGDVFVLLFFGPVAVAGTYYVQALDLDWRPIVAGVGPGLISMAILVVNNLRDIETDAQAGKRTLAVRFGVGFSRWQHTLALCAACLSPLIFLFSGDAGAGAAAPLLTLVAAIPVMRTVWTRRDGPALNSALAGTGAVLMLYATLFCIGWLL